MRMNGNRCRNDAAIERYLKVPAMGGLRRMKWKNRGHRCI